MTKAITRLEKAEKTAKIGKINANMVKVVFDNGRIETIPFTDAVLYA